MAKLSELFDICIYSGLDICNYEYCDKNIGIPYVSRTEKNNGVSAYIGKQDKKLKINEKNTLSVALVGNSVLETFYQKNEYYSSQNMGILKPKKELTMEEMIYYALCIKSHKKKYSYGRTAGRTFRNLELPDYDKIPQWVYKYKSGSVKHIESKNPIRIDFNKCEDVYLRDLFEFKKGSQKSLYDLSLKKGNIPLISGTFYNNGVSCYVDEKPDIILDGESCLTLTTDGVIGNCFLQQKSFIFTSTVCVLFPKKNIKFNKYIALYFITILQKEFKNKHSYGRKLLIHHLNNTKIKLPKKDGDIDWQLIEDYIKNIKNSFIINDIKKNDKSIQDNYLDLKKPSQNSFNLSYNDDVGEQS